MKYKNVIKTVPLFFTVITIPLVSVACKVKNPYIYTVGDEWVVSKDFTLKFESLDYQIIEDIFEIKTTFIFNNYNKEYDYSLSEEGTMIRYTSTYYPNKDKSIELSGFDIFNTKITSKSTVTFVFDILLSSFLEEKLDNESEKIFFWMQINSILTFFSTDNIIKK